MRSEMFLAMLRVLGVVALASTGYVALVGPSGTSEPVRPDDRPLVDSPLVGHWREAGTAGRYRISVSPSVLFITSFDETEICEIDVERHELGAGQGKLHGVVRLDRVARRNLPHAGRAAMVSYKLRGEVLELSWTESPELAARFGTSVLNAVREAKPEQPIAGRTP
jgi:hypothetical protein